MDVSVCILTYNQEDLIGPCLDSVLAQDFSGDLEIIVGEHTSNDSTADVLTDYRKDYPDLIRVITTPRSASIYENYRNVHSQAQGDLVATLDGDDIWLPHKLSTQVEFMASNPDAAQTWHRQLLIDEQSKVVGQFPPNAPANYELTRISRTRLALSYALCGQHSSQIYRRQFARFTADSQFGLDYAFALEIARGGPSIHLPEFLGGYRLNTSSMTQTRSGGNYVSDVLMDMQHRFMFDEPDIGKSLAAGNFARSLDDLLFRQPGTGSRMSQSLAARPGIRNLTKSTLLYWQQRLAGISRAFADRPGPLQDISKRVVERRWKASALGAARKSYDDTLRRLPH